MNIGLYTNSVMKKTFFKGTDFDTEEINYFPTQLWPGEKYMGRFGAL